MQDILFAELLILIVSNLLTTAMFVVSSAVCLIVSIFQHPYFMDLLERNAIATEGLKLQGSC